MRERRHSYLRGSDSDMDEKPYPDVKLLGVCHITKDACVNVDKAFSVADC